MNTIFKSTFLFGIAITCSQLIAEDEVRDYGLFNHEIAIDYLRAGNHDEKGVNEYYFTATVSALLNTKEALKKDLDQRERIKLDPAHFGDVTVEALRQWEPDPKSPTQLSTKIEGDSLRKLISDAMRKFNVSEQEIALMVEVEMYEKGKYLVFLGEDQFIGKAIYFPIPPTRYQLGGRVNTKLTIVDDKGTDVKIKITYEKPNVQTEMPKEEAALTGESK